MREKAENVQRDLFARLFAATRAAELVATTEANRTGVRSLRIESELYEALDDVVETIGDGTTVAETHGWQIKRQYTPLPIATIAAMLTSLSKNASVSRATLGVPVPIAADDGGELRILAELCNRLGRPGAKPDEILADLRDAEKKWLAALRATLQDRDEKTTAERLMRLRVRFIGDDDALRELLRERLEGRFKPPVEPLVAALTEYFAAVDGTVDITYAVLNDAILKNFPRTTEDTFDDVYRALIDQIENRLWLHKWNTLSDTLIRNMVPTEFVDDISELAFSIAVQPWPRKRPDLEAAIRGVVARARSYVQCFMSNCEVADAKVLRENLAYKRRFDHVAYRQGRKRSDEWDQECLIRLYNLVVALNQFAMAVRSTVNPRYRMAEGDFAVVDSLGFRNDLAPASYHPKEYVAETELTFIKIASR